MLTVTNCTVKIPTRSTSLTILNDVSFEVPKDSTISLIGRSGSGKTTALRCIAGLQTHNGIITIDGVDQSTLPAHQRNIGWVDQQNTLLPHLSVAHNIGLPLRLRKQPKASIVQSVKALMQEFNIEHIANRRPHEISGGEQQRAAVARALIHTPATLLLDEPFGALDAITRHDLTEWLLSILQQHTLTTVLITHDIREAKALTDTAVVLEHGEKIAEGNWHALSAHQNTTVQKLIATGYDATEAISAE